jgi:hypothetical protein
MRGVGAGVATFVALPAVLSIVDTLMSFVPHRPSACAVDTSN